MTNEENALHPNKIKTCTRTMMTSTTPITATTTKSWQLYLGVVDVHRKSSARNAKNWGIIKELEKKIGIQTQTFYGMKNKRAATATHKWTRSRSGTWKQTLRFEQAKIIFKSNPPPPSLSLSFSFSLSLSLSLLSLSSLSLSLSLSHWCSFTHEITLCSPLKTSQHRVLHWRWRVWDQVENEQCPWPTQKEYPCEEFSRELRRWWSHWSTGRKYSKISTRFSCGVGFSSGVPTCDLCSG